MLSFSVSQCIFAVNWKFFKKSSIQVTPKKISSNSQDLSIWILCQSEIFQQLTREHVLESRGMEELQEVGESSLAVGLERLDQIADRQGEHDPVDRVRQALGYLDVPLVGRHSGSVHRRYLTQNATVRLESPRCVHKRLYVSTRTRCLVELNAKHSVDHWMDAGWNTLFS